MFADKLRPSEKCESAVSDGLILMELRVTVGNADVSVGFARELSACSYTHSQK
ncbi:hypothetical protein LVJ83_04110 [Uruburuella testudinis]|uniref:Uncharacterized protein n=1 Tax=Uruburuella testudinis TaxID=1282863 RepID=A0ABY4DUD8_9NEIS|nr:hypothetical protein [Uruburuella testudinis]UOO82654.1 hypothetical protein LVJ83_04110 [Uruburuella testudinis]